MNDERVNKLLAVFNRIDPENLTPGQVDSPPITEYQVECKKVFAFIVKNMDKLNQSNLEDEINNIWEKYFNKKCEKAELLSRSILAEVNSWEKI
ncbi:MAG: hypothetical protein AB7S78_03245 [Candidatus Omnitrophota bacterium]